MISKKMLKILVLDEFGEHVRFFGDYQKNEIKKVVDVAKKHNMPCLSFIEMLTDTYFNYLQCHDIKREIGILRKYENLDERLLNSLYIAANDAINDDDYIKIKVLL